MAGISASINLHDGFTSVVNNMYKSLSALIGGFEAANRSSRHIIDTASLNSARESMASAVAEIGLYEQRLNNIGSASRNAFNHWNMQQGIKVFDSNGMQRLTQEMDSFNSLINKVEQNQERLKRRALDMQILPEGAAQDISIIDSEMKNLISSMQRLQNVDKNLLSTEQISQLNNKYEGQRKILTDLLNLQSEIGRGIGENDVSAVNKGFNQLKSVAEQANISVRSVNESIREMTTINWQSITNPAIFNTTGIQRAKQEFGALQSSARKVIQTQTELSQKIAGMKIVPSNAMNEINRVNSRIANIGKTIIKLEREKSKLSRWDTSGINQYNSRIESLRHNVYEIENAQRALQNAVNTNNIEALNNAYRRLNSLIDRGEREIRQNEAAQNQFNSSILNGVNNTNKLLNVYAAIGLAQKGLTAGKKLMEESFGQGFELNKIKSQFQARLGSADMGEVLFKHISDQAKVSAYDINSLTKNTASFLSVVKNVNQLDKLNRFAEQLALFDTTGQGLEGAGFSLKEALSGDIVSLAERFNMSKSLIRDFKIDELGKKGDLDGFITQFERLLEAQKMGSAAYETMLQDSKVKLDMFTSNIKTGFAEASQTALNSLTPVITRLNDWFISDSAAIFFRKISDGFTWVVNRGIEFSSWIERLGIVAKPGIMAIGGAFAKVSGYIFSAKGFVDKLITSLGRIGRSEGFIDSVNIIAGSFMTISEFASGCINTIAHLNTRFEGLFPTVTAAVVAFTTFKTINSALQNILNSVGKTISTVTAYTQAFAQMTKTATAAQQGLNIALSSNPYMLVARAIMTVVSTLVSLVAAIKAVNAAAGIANETAALIDADNTNDEALKLASSEGIPYEEALTMVQGEKSAYAEAETAMNSKAVVKAYNEFMNASKNATEADKREENTNSHYNIARQKLIDAQTANAKNDAKASAVIDEFRKSKMERIEENSKKAKAEAEKSQKELDDLLNSLKNGIDEGIGNIDNGIGNIGGDIGNIDTVGEVGKINDTIDIASEDLRYLKEIAEREAINELMTKIVVPDVKITFMGDFDGISQAKDVAEVIKESILSELSAGAEAVHV